MGLFQIAILTRVKRFERRFCALYSLWKTGRLPQAPLRPSASFAVERVNCGELGGKARPAAPQAFRVAFGQSLMNGTNDLIIGQDDVSMWHPGFMQLFDLCCDQSVTEAALQASGSNHAASLRTGTDWLSSMRGEGNCSPYLGEVLVC